MSDNKIKPFFLISLPRSGSTLLQKILMSHTEIASTAEPWFLLPLCYMLRKEGVRAPYSHPTSVDAFRRVLKETQNHCSSHELMRHFSESIYSSYTQNNEKYFLDKTPRYYLILEELYECFPNAKFLVLFRNPVSIFTSSVEAFLGGQLRRLDYLEHDFSVGPNRIGDFVEENRSQVYSMRYEDFVQSPELHLKGICNHLEISYQPEMISKGLNFQLEGHGDAIGARQYKTIRINDNKWRSMITTKISKIRLIRHLNVYSESYLKHGNYDRESMIDQISEHSVGTSLGLNDLRFWLEEKLVRAYKSSIQSL